MGSGPIGEIPVLITGDWSGLQTSIDQAANAASSGAQEIAKAFSSADTSGITNLDAKLAELYSQGFSAKDALAALSGTAGDVKDSLSALTAQTEPAAAGLGAIGTKAGEASDQIKKVSDQAQDIPPKMQQAASATQDFGNQLLTLGAGVLTFAALKGAIESVITEFGNLQAAEIAIRAFTGDVKGAADAVDMLQKLANQLGQSQDAVVTAGQRFLVLGNSIKDIPALMEAAADAAAAMDIPLSTVAGKIKDMSEAGQIMNRSLAQMGINIADVGAAMGMADAPTKEIQQAFKEMGSEADRARILAAALMEKFPDQANQAADGVKGAWQRIKNDTQDVFQDVGKSLDGFKGLVDIVAVAIKVVAGTVQSLIGGIKLVVDVLIGLGGQIAEFFIGVGNAIVNAVTGKFAAAADNFRDMTTRMTAYGDAMVQDLKKDWTDNTKILSDLISGTTDKISTAFDGVSPHINAVRASAELLNKATNELAAGQLLLTATLEKLNPVSSSVEAAEINVANARESVAYATKQYQDALTNLAAVQAQAVPSQKELQAALLAESAAKQNVKQANLELTDATKNLTTAKKQESDVSKLLADADKDFSNTLQALHIPMLKTLADAEAEVTAKKADLIAADAAERDSAIALSVVQQTNAKDSAAVKTAEDNLAAARLDVKAKTDSLKASEKDLSDLRSTITRANTELAAGEAAITKALKDQQESSATLQGAVSALVTAKQSEATATDNLKTAEDALRAAKAATTGTDQSVKDATDAARTARENLRVATTAVTTAEQVLQGSFGVSKNLMDQLGAGTIQLGDTTKGLEDAYHNLGMKSATDLQTLAAAANDAYGKIVASGTGSATQLATAWEKVAQDNLNLAIALGASTSQIQQLELVLEQAKDRVQELHDAAMTLVNVFNSVRDAVTGAFQSITSTLVKDLFEGVNNDALKQQIQGVQQSMADATTSWQQAQQDIAAQMKQAVIDNKQALDQELANLQSQLDDKTKAYADYVANYQSQLADLQKAEQDKTAEQVQALKDNLTQEEQSYDQFKSDTIQKMEDLTQASKENLEQQLSNLQDQLANQTLTYDRYVEDVNTKLSRIGEDLQQQIGDRSTQEQRSVADKNTQIQRDTQDANERIKRLREQETAANKDSTEQQISDIQLSLSRKQQDAQTYVQRQIQDLQTFTDEHNKQAQEQTDDLKKQLQQRTDDYNAYVADNQKQQDDATSAAKKALADQEMALVASLLKRQVQLTIDKISTQAKIEAVTKANEDELLKREAELKASLDKQTTAYEDAKTKIEQQMVDATAKAKAELATQETNLQTSLDKQATAYKTTMDGYSGQLDTLQAKFKTVWDGIADGLTSVGERMLTNIMVAFFNPMIKNIADFIAGSIADLLGKIGFGGVQDAVGIAIPDAVQGLNDAFNRLGKAGVDAASEINTAMAGVAPSAGAPAGGAAGDAGGAVGAIGKVTGSILSSVSSIVGMVTGAITAITGIISIFQNMHQETSLNAIEHNTRYSMMYLGERSDGGILGVLFKIDEELAFGTATKKIETMSNDIESVAKPFWSYGLKDLDAIKDHTYWAMKDLDEIKTQKSSSSVKVEGKDLGEIITGLQNINNTLQFEVGLSPWFQTAFQNINNGIVACAGWLQGIAGILQAGISTTGSSNTTTGLGALASYVGQNFTALENWLFNALGKTMALPALPGAIALPAALGGPTTNPGTTIVINNTVNGSVVGQNGMNQFANGIGDMLVNKLRSSGMKY